MKVIPSRYKIIPSKRNSNDVIYIYQKYYQDAKSILRKWGCNSQIFKDIYQDVFIILMDKQMNSGTETGISSGYIINLCKYLWFKERKREQIHELNDQTQQDFIPVEICNTCCLSHYKSYYFMDRLY